MDGVILFADDDVLTAGSTENDLFSKFNENANYSVLPIDSLKDLKTTLDSMSIIKVLILDWDFKEKNLEKGMPEKSRNPMEILSSSEIYSLIYIYSRTKLSSEIQNSLLGKFGTNKIFFNEKKSGPKAATNEFKKICDDITKYEKANKQMEVPFLWSKTINKSAQKIFLELEKANEYWLQEIIKTAKEDKADEVMEVINIFNNLLNESLVQNKDLRDSINKNEKITVKNESKKKTAKLYQRLFYSKILHDSPIMTGDIYKFDDNEYGILITPECNLARINERNYEDSENDKNKSIGNEIFYLEFLQFSCKQINDMLQKKHSYEISTNFNDLNKKRKDSLRKIFNNDEPSLHILPSFPFDEENYNQPVCINFKKALITRDKKEVEGKRTKFKLNSPYIQQLRQRFLAYFGRYGVPAVPDSLKEYNLNK